MKILTEKEKNKVIGGVCKRMIIVKDHGTQAGLWKEVKGPERGVCVVMYSK